MRAEKAPWLLLGPQSLSKASPVQFPGIATVAIVPHHSRVYVPIRHVTYLDRFAANIAEFLCPCGLPRSSLGATSSFAAHTVT